MRDTRAINPLTAPVLTAENWISSEGWRWFAPCGGGSSTLGWLITNRAVVYGQVNLRKSLVCVCIVTVNNFDRWIFSFFFFSFLIETQISPQTSDNPHSCLLNSGSYTIIFPLSSQCGKCRSRYEMFVWVLICRRVYYVRIVIFSKI